jgi:hypothetical protein
VNLWIAFAMAAGLGASACATPAATPITGESLADHGPHTRGVGDPAPGFVFVTEGHRLRSLAEVRGDVTLVVFSDDPAWPGCQFCRAVAMLAESMSDDAVDVRVVTLARPERDADDALAALRACAIPSDRLVAITDRADTIRESWGVDAGGRWFIVNHWGRIEATGPVSDLATAERFLGRTVERENALLHEQSAN